MSVLKIADANIIEAGLDSRLIVWGFVKERSLNGGVYMYLLGMDVSRHPAVPHQHH